MRSALLTVVALAACQQADGPGTIPHLMLVPAAGGLLVEGSGGREIGFGRDSLGVLQSVERIEGRAPRPAPCGFGREAVVTEDGLRLVFEGGSFVGWKNAGGSAGKSCT